MYNTVTVFDSVDSLSNTCSRVYFKDCLIDI